MAKPFKGSLHHWRKRFLTEAEKQYIVDTLHEDPGLGYIIVGHFSDHPDFAGMVGHTSWVVKHFKNGSIHTRNSRYKLVGAEHGQHQA